MFWKTLVVITALVFGAPFAHAFSGNAAPPPRCVITDPSGPTNIRTRPNGVILSSVEAGTVVTVVDQQRAYDGLWDFVFIAGESRGWVYDPLIRCY